MDTDQSQLSPVQAQEQEGDNDVIVIHEHHHHHHHEDEDQGNDTATTGSLLENILNDEVLYDFVSFLIEEAQSNNERKEIAESEGDLGPWNLRSYLGSDTDYEDIRREDRLEMEPSHNTKQFLDDGFEPIVEVELDK